MEQLLATGGCDADSRGPDSTSPIHLASYGAIMRGRDLTTSMEDYSHCLALLKANGADIDSRDASSWTPLLIASR